LGSFEYSKISYPLNDGDFTSSGLISAARSSIFFSSSTFSEFIKVVFRFFNSSIKASSGSPSISTGIILLTP